MSARTRAIAAAKSVEHTVLEYTASQDHFGEHSVTQLGVDPRGTLKTLVVSNSAQPREMALCCVPVAGHLSLKAAAKALGWKKAQLAEPKKAEHATGYIVGGISPLGTLQKLPVLIDASVTPFPTIIVSAGQRGLSLELSPNDLAALAGAKFAKISTD